MSPTNVAPSRGSWTVGSSSALGGASPPPGDDWPNSKYDQATKGRSAENKFNDPVELAEHEALDLVDLPKRLVDA